MTQMRHSDPPARPRRAATAVNRTPGRLQLAPSFVQTRTLDGRPYLAKDVEPYEQFWINERERVLLGLFGARGGCTEAEAEAAYFRLTERPASAPERQRVRRAVAGMRAAGVLLERSDDDSRYDHRIVADYIAHRPFPRALADRIAARAAISADTRVLDLAGGPGDLALALASHTRHAAVMELSRGFLACARRRARGLGLPLQTLHDSCNRLLHRDEPWDVITVAQALHWLDDVAVCRGVVRLLQRGGSFFVVHSSIELPDAHPLAYLLGHDSILGAKPRQPFTQDIAPLQRRIALLFEALDTPGVERIDPARSLHASGESQRIREAGVELFQQTRPFDEGYARGFLTPAHTAATGLAPEAFWADVHARCRNAHPQALLGTHHWALLHYQRGATGPLPALNSLPVTPLGYGPATR